MDDDPSPGRFILTGSVEPAAYGPTYPLTGRALRLMLRPMTRAELTGQGAAPTFLDRVLAGALAPGTGAEPFSIGWIGQSGFPAGRVMEDPTLLLDAYATTVAQGPARKAAMQPAC